MAEKSKPVWRRRAAGAFMAAVGSGALFGCAPQYDHQAALDNAIHPRVVKVRVENGHTYLDGCFRANSGVGVIQWEPQSAQGDQPEKPWNFVFHLADRTRPEEKRNVPVRSLDTINQYKSSVGKLYTGEAYQEADERPDVPVLCTRELEGRPTPSRDAAHYNGAFAIIFEDGYKRPSYAIAPINDSTKEDPKLSWATKVPAVDGLVKVLQRVPLDDAYEYVG